MQVCGVATGDIVIWRSTIDSTTFLAVCWIAREVVGREWLSTGAALLWHTQAQISKHCLVNGDGADLKIPSNGASISKASLAASTLSTTIYATQLALAHLVLLQPKCPSVLPLPL